MRVLITGNEGYIGSVVAEDLARAGHHVEGLDTGFFNAGLLYHHGSVRPRTMVKDVREVTLADLEGFDAVVHMAELSNDPLGALDPDLTRSVNHRGAVRLASLARDAGVSRFVHMSSCSVYGLAEDGVVSEASPVNPLTEYAKCKVMVERDVAAMATADFSPTFLRNATAFGASPRIRFDVVLNNLSGIAWTSRRIVLTSDGSPWRPLVHVLDIAQAIRLVLGAPAHVVSGEVLNVGSDEQNYRIRDVAQVVAEVFPGCDLEFGRSGGDDRSYRVSFAKIHEVLPAFSCQWDLRRGAHQLHDVFSLVQLTADQFEGRGHIRLKQLEYLMATGQVDRDLRWTGPT